MGGRCTFPFRAAGECLFFVALCAPVALSQSDSAAPALDSAETNAATDDVENAAAASARGDFQKVVFHTDKALRLLGDQPQILFMQGVAFARLDRHEEALVCFRRADEAGYEGPDLALEQGLALYRLGRHDEAASQLEAAAAQEGEFTGYARLYLGLSRLALKDFDSAERALKTVAAGGQDSLEDAARRGLEDLHRARAERRSPWEFRFWARPLRDTNVPGVNSEATGRSLAAWGIEAGALAAYKFIDREDLVVKAGVSPRAILYASSGFNSIEAKAFLDADWKPSETVRLGGELFAGETWFGKGLPEWRLFKGIGLREEFALGEHTTLRLGQRLIGFTHLTPFPDPLDLDGSEFEISAAIEHHIKSWDLYVTPRVSQTWKRTEGTEFDLDVTDLAVTLVKPLGEAPEGEEPPLLWGEAGWNSLRGRNDSVFTPFERRRDSTWRVQIGLSWPLGEGPFGTELSLQPFLSYSETDSNIDGFDVGERFMGGVGVEVR